MSYRLYSYTFFLFFSLNGCYLVLQLFLGSTLRNLAVRHKLLIPVFARFVRFRPKTCINMACMRVELYSYPDSGKYGWGYQLIKFCTWLLRPRSKPLPFLYIPLLTKKVTLSYNLYQYSYSKTLHPRSIL